MTRWIYQGDINLEYGGIFFDLSDWKHGYVNAVEVTDLASACGFEGALLIESKSIKGTDDNERVSKALDCIGAKFVDRDGGDIDMGDGHVLRKGSQGFKLCVAYSLNAYGYADVDRSETVQPNRDCKTQFDGWSAERIRSNGLRAYVRKEFLGLSR